MRRGGLSSEHGVVVGAALVASESNAPVEGFRQRDVRFYVELFSNWLHSTRTHSGISVHNAQIQRLLEELASARHARQLGRSRPPRYRLTPLGVFEALGSLVYRKELGRLEEVFLIFHILNSYGGRLRQLAEQGGPLSAAPVRVDLGELLDSKRFLRRYLELLDLEIRKLDARVDDSLKIAAVANKELRAGRSMDDVIDLVQRQFPYELNHQKPLALLMSELPAAIRELELTELARRRANELWAPVRALLSGQRLVVQTLLAGESAAGRL